MDEQEAEGMLAHMLATNLILMAMLAEAAATNPTGRIAAMVKDPELARALIPHLPELDQQSRERVEDNLQRLLLASRQRGGPGVG